MIVINSYYITSNVIKVLIINYIKGVCRHKIIKCTN